MIPGLENAEFARLGGIHRNTFINSPKLLDSELRLKTAPYLRFAGQITGVEGYVESAACGLMAGRFAAAELQQEPAIAPPATTALGALLHHVTGGAEAATFQPMNMNFGLFPPLQGRVKKDARAQGYTSRALADLSTCTRSCVKYSSPLHLSQGFTDYRSKHENDVVITGYAISNSTQARTHYLCHTHG
jgi:methylenetetrahydrofolate--tRNA-(uracil-5-)-methyltransferase